MIFALLLLLRLVNGSEFSPLETELVETEAKASSPHCSVAGMKTEECCFICDACARCESCASPMCSTCKIEGCKFCPLCPKDCVKSGFCGKVCELEDLPETRECVGCGCKQKGAGGDAEADGGEGGEAEDV